MAQTLNQARAKIQTSVHGRKLGIDAGERLVTKGSRKAVTAATSDTTGTNLPNHGYVSVITTTDDSWVLTDPEVGCEVTLFTGSTSTGVHTVTGDNAVLLSSDQTTMGVISFVGGGGMSCKLFGISTGVWGVESRSSTGGVLFTTA